jgi:hypothetical protein
MCCSATAVPLLPVRASDALNAHRALARTARDARVRTFSAILGRLNLAATYLPCRRSRRPRYRTCSAWHIIAPSLIGEQMSLWSAGGAKNGNWKIPTELTRPYKTQPPRPHLERCIKAGCISSSAIAIDFNARGIAAPIGGQWFPMQVRRVRDRLGL